MNIEEAICIYGKIKVLHLDDEELQLENLKVNLEQLNENIIIESEINSSRALEKIKNNEYDCVLLDYLMPTYDGIQIGSKIRNFTNIPIILYTIDESEEIDKKIINNNIDYYIRKISDINNYSILERKISNMVKKYRTQKINEELLNNINDLIVIIDKDHNIIYHNKKFKKFVNDVNYIGESILKVIGSDFKEYFYDFLINKEEPKIEINLLSNEEINCYLEVNKLRLKDSSDCIILIFTDISSNVVGSEINTITEDRFSAIAQMSPDAIVTISLFGYITYINPAFERLTGFSQKEILGKHIINVPTMKGRGMKFDFNAWKSMLLGGDSEVSSVEFPYTRKDGSSGIGDVYLKMINIKGKREIITIVKDVTERRKREEEYENIFRSSPEGIIHVDMEGNIKNINDSCIDILVIKREKFIGHSIISLEEKFDTDRFKYSRIFDDVISGLIIEPYIIKYDVNDIIKWLEIYISMIKVYDENFGIQILIRDISDKKEIEEKRDLYTNNLEKMVEERTNQIMDNEKMVTLAKISSQVAHDLKGPLQIISNSIHLIKLKPDNKEQYIEYIENAVKQANELIEEMRVKGKDSPLKLSNVNFDKILEEALIQVKISENIKFEKIIKTDKKIRLDEFKIIRVFNNLFKNSIEAMPNGGKITIIVEEKQNNISIEVIDNGLGIPEEKINNLFRPFQSTKSKGMGLGLNYCKNAVEAHGGSISVKSKEGKGTTFTILIPLDGNYENNDYIEDSIDIKDTLI